MNISLVMFLAFILATLGITYWASRSTGTTTEFLQCRTAHHRVSERDGPSPATTCRRRRSRHRRLIAFYGYDGFMYSVGWLVAYSDGAAARGRAAAQHGPLHDGGRARVPPAPPVVRVVAAASTLTVSLFYMIAQMVGAGSLVSLLVPGVGFNTAIVGVGALMLVYVIFGGMLATTWVQIVKAVLLMTGTVLLSSWCWRASTSRSSSSSTRRGVTGSFCLDGVARQGVCPDGTAPIVRDFTQPGLYYHGRWGALSLMSLGIALIFGPPGLPHILVRFYTVPSARERGESVVWAMILIGAFYS
jgi:cation/acetate symporter